LPDRDYHWGLLGYYRVVSFDLEKKTSKNSKKFTFSDKFCNLYLTLAFKMIVLKGLFKTFPQVELLDAPMKNQRKNRKKYPYQPTFDVLEGRFRW